MSQLRNNGQFNGVSVSARDCPAVSPLCKEGQCVVVVVVSACVVRSVMPRRNEGHRDDVVVSSGDGPALMPLCKEGHGNAALVSACVAPASMHVCKERAW